MIVMGMYGIMSISGCNREVTAFMIVIGMYGTMSLET